MTIKELEKRLEKEDLLEVHFEYSIKKYINGEKLYYNNEVHNCVDTFGIFKDKDGFFCFFVTESERGGILEYIDDYKNEDEACEALLKYIYREERIYKNEHDYL